MNTRVYVVTQTYINIDVIPINGLNIPVMDVLAVFESEDSAQYYVGVLIKCSGQKFEYTHSGWCHHYVSPTIEFRITERNLDD